MTENKTKVVLTVAGILFVVCLIAAIIWQFNVIKNQQTHNDQVLVEMKQLQDNTIRSQAKYVSPEDLEKFAESAKIDLEPIRDDLDTLNAEIKGIGSLLATTPGYRGTSLPSNSATPRKDPVNTTVSVPCTGDSAQCPNLDKFGYLNNVQILSLNEPFSDGKSIPWGETAFKSWEEKPWSLDIFPRQYSVTTVLGEDENGRHYTYHKFVITSNGTAYPVKIDDSKFVEEFPSSSFRFSPRIYLGVDVGAHVYPLPQAEIMPNVSVTLFSYGRTKVKPNFTFVGLGAGFNTQSETFAVALTPFTYNVGQHIPLMENLHVGPSISVDTDGSIAVTGGIKVGL